MKVRFSSCHAALLIVALGFGLRLVNLGSFDFWFDEVGQVLVGRAASPLDAIRTAAEHLGAAPLDYVITWFGVRLLGESEFALRYIPVFWSALTLALVYAIGERLQRGLGNWAALLAAISPLGIRYAQEVRFYALALMLCALTLWLALQRSERGWLWTVTLALAMTLGLYAHVYTALIWPFILWALLCVTPARARTLLLRFSLAAALACLLFAPWLFGELLAEQIPPFADAAGFNLETARRVLAGWEMPNFAPVAARNTASQPLPYLIAALHIVALFLALRRARTSPVWIGALGVYGLASLAVVLNDMRTGYFFAPRQILNLLLLRALFGGWILQQTGVALARWRPPLRVALAVSVVVIALPSISAYYANWRDKSNASQIAEVVAHFGADAWWIAPAYDQLTVNYYLERAGHARPPVWRAFPDQKVDHDTARQAASSGRATVVVLQSAYATPDALSALEAAGFGMLWPVDGATGNEHFVALGRR